MKVRTRLVLAFSYILITVIVALTVPLTINLRERARSDVENRAKLFALTIAAGIGAEGLTDTALTGQATRYAAQIEGRVTILDKSGDVLVDVAAPGTDLYPEGGPATPGTSFVSAERPEVAQALGLSGTSPSASAQVRRSEVLGHDVLAAAAPILDESHAGQIVLQGAVRISEDVQSITDSVRRVTIGVVVIGLTGLASGLIIAFALAGSLAKPLTTLTAAATRLGDGDLTSRAGNVDGGREFDELARSFDEMADRLERTVQAQREFVANASHQLRTPLTGMKLRLESAKNDAPAGELRTQLEAADREVDRLAEIVDRLLTMATQIEEGQPTRVDLGDSAARAVERWRDRAEHLHSTIEASGSGALAQGNPADLDQVLDNLLENAIAYAPGAIHLETGTKGNQTFVVVRDHGPGIPREEQARVTDRFYRGRGAPSGGSGLGLAIARQLTEKWGGSLTVSDADGGGTRIEVRLRLAGTPATTLDRTEEPR